MIKIAIYGRGGQGAKTAAHIIAEASFFEGKHVQAFPEYGPERSGAPMRSFIKVDSEPITDYSPFSLADFIIIIDPSLLLSEEIKEKIKSMISSKTKLIINSKTKIEGLDGIYYDASSVALKNIGKDFSNVVLVGVFAKVSGMIDIKNVEKSIKETLKDKSSMIDANIKSIREAYNGV